MVQHGNNMVIYSLRLKEHSQTIPPVDPLLRRNIMVVPRVSMKHNGHIKWVFDSSNRLTTDEFRGQKNTVMHRLTVKVNNEGQMKL